MGGKRKQQRSASSTNVYPTAKVSAGMSTPKTPSRDTTPPPLAHAESSPSKRRKTSSRLGTPVPLESEDVSRAVTQSLASEGRDIFESSLSLSAELSTSVPKISTVSLTEHAKTLLEYVRAHSDRYTHIAGPDHLPDASQAFQVMPPELAPLWPSISAELEKAAILYRGADSDTAIVKKTLEDLALRTRGFDITKKTERGGMLARRRSSIDLLPNPFARDKATLSSVASPRPAPTLKIKLGDTGKFRVYGKGPSTTVERASGEKPGGSGRTGGKKRTKGPKPPKPRDKPAGSSGAAGSQKSVAAGKPAVPNQISSGVFWTYVEHFFKPITDTDLAWLDPDTYHKLSASSGNSSVPVAESEEQQLLEYMVTPSLGSALPPLAPVMPALSDEPAPGSLTSRLMCALIEDKDPSLSSTGDVSPDDSAVVPASTLFSYRKRWTQVEERLKQELSELGLLSEGKPQTLYEDDEVCAALRQLQTRLQIQSALNRRRRRQLFDFLFFKRNIVSSQEYYLVLEELHKKLEAVYAQKKKGIHMLNAVASSPSGATVGQFKKKKKAGSLSLPRHHGSGLFQTTGGDAARSVESVCWELLEKRDLLRRELGPLVPYRYELLPETPPTSLYRLPACQVPPSECISNMNLPPSFSAAVRSPLFNTAEEQAWLLQEKSKYPFPLIESADLSLDSMASLSTMADPLAKSEASGVSVHHPAGSTGTATVSVMGMPTKLALGKKKIKLVVPLKR